ncbi:MAG: type II toxin-antitoxin system RelE/ParE family toxin [Myxacorys chilensis ATA2-1-KO14]|jgi:toxin ParE1/3/4|nr:type II toxin-antitoxin system RelE/ParE family toxin [Myxacorys chilensis ATA2-1-KO14]
MIRRISIRPAAIVDLDQHVAYLNQNNSQAAMRFFDAARQTFATLARMPSIGRIYRTGEDETQYIRRWSIKGFKNYLIFYRSDDTVIEIIRVLHAAQDLDRLLEDFN